MVIRESDTGKPYNCDLTSPSMVQNAVSTAQHLLYNESPAKLQPFEEAPACTAIVLQGDDRRSAPASLLVRPNDDYSAQSLTPPAFLRAFDVLSDFRSEQQKPWLPENIDIKVCAHTPITNALDWPADWPTLNADLIALPSKYLPQLVSMLAQNRLFRDHGKCWSIDYTIRFPDESR
jgi:hypothetical protein